MTRRLPRQVCVYRVGGSVRDELLGRPDADRDFVVVGATPEMMLASGYRPVGRDFPVFLHPETHDEYALARTERKHGHGYRGFEFFASPDVTLEEDLARRDLTINAMARGDDGILVDPFGGAADLAAGVLRHVSPAFAEDPLRVLRVARFAARFEFAIAAETEAAMRALVATGELATLAPERVWQELARGLMEGHPSRMLEVLRDCGALAALLPEVATLCGVAQPATETSESDTGLHVALALDWAAARGSGLPVRYAVLSQHLGSGRTSAANKPRHQARHQRGVRLAARQSARLRVPIDCRDAAALAARWACAVHRVEELRPAALLAVLTAADALRRPERLAGLLEACAADAGSRPGAPQDYRPAQLWREALRVVQGVDGGSIARVQASRADAAPDAIPKAIRAARLRALRQWRRARRSAPGG